MTVIEIKSTPIGLFRKRSIINLLSASKKKGNKISQFQKQSADGTD